MKFENVSGEWDLVNGTSLKGRIHATFERLCEVFGEPVTGGDKTQVEWAVLFEDGTIATIYDWKEDISPQFVTDWHIGGKTQMADLLVYEAVTL